MSALDLLKLGLLPSSARCASEETHTRRHERALRAHSSRHRAWRGTARNPLSKDTFCRGSVTAKTIHKMPFRACSRWRAPDLMPHQQRKRPWSYPEALRTYKRRSFPAGIYVLSYVQAYVGSCVSGYRRSCRILENDVQMILPSPAKR